MQKVELDLQDWKEMELTTISLLKEAKRSEQTTIACLKHIEHMIKIHGGITKEQEDAKEKERIKKELKNSTG